MHLIVLTKNYGRGFTGATNATHALIDQWRAAPTVSVTVCTQHVVGPINTGIELKCALHRWELLRTLRSLHRADPTAIGYSDDHLGYLLKLAGIHYVHTYHGNWPAALWSTGLLGWLQGGWLIPQYILTMWGAFHAVAVSHHAAHFTRHFVPTTVIYNGVQVSPVPVIRSIKLTADPLLKLLMVGGVDQRKYRKLLILLRRLPKSVRRSLRIDIYGAIHDERLGDRLRETDGVRLMGQTPVVPYAQYAGLLTTSAVENLSIAVVEALVSGIPVLGYAVGGLPEVVTNGHLGRLVPLSRTDELAGILTTAVLDQVNFAFDNRALTISTDWQRIGQTYLTLLKRV